MQTNIIRLVFARTKTDNVTNTWTALKTVVVEIPLENNNSSFPWQLIGGEWLSNKDQ